MTTAATAPSTGTLHVDTERLDALAAAVRACVEPLTSFSEQRSEWVGPQLGDPLLEASTARFVKVWSAATGDLLDDVRRIADAISLTSGLYRVVEQDVASTFAWVTP